MSASSIEIFIRVESTDDPKKKRPLVSFRSATIHRRRRRRRRRRHSNRTGRSRHGEAVHTVCNTSSCPYGARRPDCISFLLCPFYRQTDRQTDGRQRRRQPPNNNGRCADLMSDCRLYWLNDINNRPYLTRIDWLMAKKMVDQRILVVGSRW